MNRLPGHEDLKPREVVGVDSSGKLLVDYGEAGIKRFRLFVAPNGGLKAAPFTEEAQTDNGIDQLGKREAVPLSKRMMMIDQGA